MTNSFSAESFIRQLGMIPHTEGGFYRETYHAGSQIETSQGLRDLSSSIYFLLKASQVSVFHELKSDELWYYHAGCPLSIYVMDKAGVLTELKLGLDLDQGELPQVLVPKNSIFGSLPKASSSNDFSLVGCMVSPGFVFEDFRVVSRQELMSRYPQYEKVICRLTRPDPS